MRDLNQQQQLSELLLRVLPTSVALSLIGDLQDVILTGSTLLAALCVLALKSLLPVQKPINSSGSKLKLKVGSPHELLHQQHQPTNAGAKGHFNFQQFQPHHALSVHICK